MMKTWDVKVIWIGGLGDTDDHYTEVEAETIEQAAQQVWDEWKPTGWNEAVISGSGECGFLNLDLPTIAFERW